jgi:hypothetical protein
LCQDRIKLNTQGNALNCLQWEQVVETASQTGKLEDNPNAFYLEIESRSKNKTAGGVFIVCTMFHALLFVWCQFWQ